MSTFKECRFFSKGNDGVIFYPSIFLKKRHENLFVSKISTAENIKNEKYIYDSLPEKFNNVFYEKICYKYSFKEKKVHLDNQIKEWLNVKKKQNPEVKYDSIISIKFFEGHNLNKIITNLVETSFDDIRKLLKRLRCLLNFVNSLNNKYYIFHRDINERNILFNINTYDIRLIDFVRSRKYDTPFFPINLPINDNNALINVINNVLDFAKKKFECDLFKQIKTEKDLCKRLIQLKIHKNNNKRF